MMKKNNLFFSRSIIKFQSQYVFHKVFQIQKHVFHKSVSGVPQMQYRVATKNMSI